MNMLIQRRKAEEGARKLWREARKCEIMDK